MKGIILSGGSGSRLYPLTLATSKQLLSVYDKPMVYFPLSVLMLAGIKEIAIITNTENIETYTKVLNNGNQWGIDLHYIPQPSPEGLAQAFILAEDFLDNSPSAMILGDNLFYGDKLSTLLEAANNSKSGATIFGYRVSNPSEYGVIDFDSKDRPISIEEKPRNPNSNCAVSGLYFFDSDVCKKAKMLKPSKRGELEITDLINSYLIERNLKVIRKNFERL